MRLCRSRIAPGRPAVLFFVGLIFTGIVAQLRCADTAAVIRSGSQEGKADRAKLYPQIQCITPDGRLSAVANTLAVDSRATASIIDDNTLSCPLQEGETTFIIALPNNALRDRLTFINENAAACGELKIAVSNSPLPAASPKWIEVDGIVPFAHKRLFNLSMLGVETKFVRLSFRVESTTENADRGVAHISETFRASALAEAISSHFAKLHEQPGDILASSSSLSVAPLPSQPNE